MTAPQPSQERPQPRPRPTTAAMVGGGTAGRGLFLRQRPPHYDERRAAFFSPTTHTLAIDAPAPRPPLCAALASDYAPALLSHIAALDPDERPRVVYVCGGSEAATTPPVEWWHEPLRFGWRMRQWHNAADRRTAIYEHGERGAPDHVMIDLRMSAGWWGADGAAALDPQTCVRAWRILARQLRTTFGNADHPAVLLATPAQTGIELFEASLPARLLVETLPESLRDELHAVIATQGRSELREPRGAFDTPRIERLIELDARWMYAACLRGLPIGPMRRDTTAEYAGYTPGFYRIWFRVPTTWRHIGLLPLITETGVTYPDAPGQTYTGWVGGAELDLARRCGWDTEILERILWPETRNLPDVAETWIDKLRRLRESTQAGRRPEDALVSAALRHLAIDTVGRWASRGGMEYGILPLSQGADLPAGAAPRVLSNAAGVNMIEWRRERPLRDDALPFAHPEWAATVWSRSRTRLARYVIGLGAAQVVALRNDAAWLSIPRDTDVALSYGGAAVGAPGTWRVKSDLIAPQGTSFEWPRSHDELLALMALARAA